MAARPPASQRPPPPPSTDPDPPRRDEHDPSDVHHTHLATSSSSAAPDGEQHAMAPSRHVPSRAARPSDRPQPTPYRVPTPPYQHSRNVSLDNLSNEEDETPYVPAVASSSRHTSSVESSRRKPADEIRGRGPRESARRPTPPFAGSSRSRDASRGGATHGAVTPIPDKGPITAAPPGSDFYYPGLTQRTRGESARGDASGGDGSKKSENSDKRTTSGTRSVPTLRPVSTTSTDEPFVPMPSTAAAEPPPPPPPAPLPVFNFNRERYPAYDIHARRIGLEHTRFETTAPQGGSYYRPRTHFYPSPEVTAGHYPHIMEIDLSAPPPAPLPSRDADPAPTQPPAPVPQALSRPIQRLRTPPTPEPVEETSTRSPSPPPAQPSEAEAETGTDPAQESDAEQDGEVEPEAEAAAGPAVNTTPFLREQLGLGPEEEVSLRALADPPEGEKPNYPYPTLIKLAIYGSPHRRLTLQEIYLALENRFQWYRDNAGDKSWQNSIRHNLSLNKCFRRIPKPVTEPGKGSFWVVDYSQGTGNKRERKRNKKPTKAQLRRLAEEAARAEAAGEAGEVEQPGNMGASTSVLRLEPPPPPPPPPSSTQRDPFRPIRPPERISSIRESQVESVVPPDTDPSPAVECAFGTGTGPPRPDSRSSHGTPVTASPQDDAHIDPQLRGHGHVVGDGRTRLPPSRPVRRTTSPYLAPVQIRQSARLNARRTATYDAAFTRSRSPSPLAGPSTSRRANTAFARSAFGPSTSGPTSYEQSALARTSAQPQPRFGQGSLSVTTQYTVPGPSNWTPYGSQPSLSLHRPPPLPPSRPSAPSLSNALGLAGVPSDLPGSSTYVTSAPSVPSSSSSHTVPRPAPRPVSRSTAAGSSRPDNTHRDRPEASSNRRRGSGGRRGVYTDSRGNVYPPQGKNGDSYSSGSSPDG